LKGLVIIKQIYVLLHKMVTEIELLLTGLILSHGSRKQ